MTLDLNHYDLSEVLDSQDASWNTCQVWINTPPSFAKLNPPPQVTQLLSESKR